MSDPSWALVPVEILCIIFMHVSLRDQLTSLRCVCTRWRDVLTHTSFWLNRLRVEGMLIDDAVLSALLAHQDSGEVLRNLQTLCYITCSKREQDQQHTQMVEPKIPPTALLGSVRQRWDSYVEDE
ncbi:unnamed protein product, partial [Meganyctiphanes norvegica]